MKHSEILKKIEALAVELKDDSPDLSTAICVLGCVYHDGPDYFKILSEALAIIAQKLMMAHTFTHKANELIDEYLLRQLEKVLQPDKKATLN